MLDGVLDDMSRHHIQTVEHTTVREIESEPVSHGLGITPLGAWIIQHDGTDGFRMYPDLEDADRYTCPVRFTESGVTVWIAFVA